MKENWKLIIHLLFTTKRFGVNNQWWSTFDSIFGIPWYERTPRRILLNYQMAKFRAVACYAVTQKTAEMLFGKD